MNDDENNFQIGSQTPPPNEGVVPRPIDAEVDEIIVEEADKLMRAEDRARELQFAPPKRKRSLKVWLGAIWTVWWTNTRLRNTTLIGIFLLILVAVFVPYTRYGILNSAGVRVSASTVVVDSQSGRPLKNIPVTLQGKQQRTNDDGYAHFDGLKLGSSQLKIEKKGFAPYEKSITLGWGSNPLDNQRILATGARFTFTLKDWLSQSIIKEGEASSGEDVGQADDEGTIELVVGEVDDDADVMITREGYRSELRKLGSLNADNEDILMVPDKKHAFVSNRNGQYDLYAIDADGQQEKLLLEATGKEREIPYVVPHPTRDVIAYLSSRDGDTNTEKFILDGLFIVTTNGSEVYKVTRSEQIQVVGWSGNKLIFVSVIEGVSAGNSQRSKLTSYDLDTRSRTDLATSNYFNDVKLIGDKVYYAVSSYAVPRDQAKLFSINVDGSDKRTLLSDQVWSIVREDYATTLFDTEKSEWYEQSNGGDLQKLDAQPAQHVPRIFTTNRTNTYASWIDVRDGKGVLLSHEIEKNVDTVVVTESGITDPAYWISEWQIIYRVNTSQETADYVVDIRGGEPRKIVDVIGNRSRYFY
ncbi:MAG TPA: DUF5050 domain-containing protein [Candidatus Saccharibacteria bacterium]|jgi:hypothetical protein|nr:DUF5050 domain-containing protein [Candidatus Saccharibacteria bacterium]